MEALAEALHVQPSHVSRRDLIAERDNARAELKEQRRVREGELEEFNIVKASRDLCKLALMSLRRS